ncbi:MAG: MerR family transcriptional regulator [Abyssibacter sp.]|uniref:MerR family transcriptional regulator n=1 Tax=Abyssibacter sp. TaxID=2320200 RepID=UPI002EB10194|nr:MerR family transcriptional regulator [Pseudomonadota bacterium]
MGDNTTTSADPQATRGEQPAEYRIRELSRLSGTSVRNIRAYQDRGLIPPPIRRGRVSIYNYDHLSRLRVISEMISRGYTLTSIGELFQAMEAGHDIADLMGLQRAVSSPWTDEVPQTYSLADLMRMFRGHFSPRWLMIATDLGLLEQTGAKFRAPSPRIVHAAAELVAAGIPFEDMVSVVRKLRANVEAASEDMVRLVERHCFDKYGPGLPPAEKVPELAELVWRLRPLVEQGVLSEVARSMEIAANKHLGDRLSYVLESLYEQQNRSPETASEPNQDP